MGENFNNDCPIYNNIVYIRKGFMLRQMSFLEYISRKICKVALNIVRNVRNHY